MSYSKYYLYKKQYSTDGGVHWYDVIPLEEVASGDPIGHYETLAECQGIEPMYRWIQLDPSTDYYCSGTTKMYKEQKQVSTDGGATWENVIPAEYREGGVAQTESTDCGYVPPVTTKKFSASYSNGDTYELDCNYTDHLTVTDTRPEGYDNTSMRSAIIGDCVTSIDKQAFSNFTSLSSVTIPSSVTSINDAGISTMDFGAFYKCTSLANITLPDSLTYIGVQAFRECTAIRNIVIPSGVTSIGDMAFSGCTRLRSIVIPSGVSEIKSNTFDGNTMLSAVTLGNATTSIGGYAFNECTSLTGITLPNSLSTIGSSAFKGCTSLTGSLTIPDNVTTIAISAFHTCSGLTSITIGSSVASIASYVFYNCRGLNDITITASLPPTLGAYAFNNTNNCPIYCPDASVVDYRLEWSDYADRIKPISEKP